MATSSATGHVKNVDTLDTLISSVVGYGAAYNPAKASLVLSELQAMAASGRNVIAAEHNGKVAEKNAGDAPASRSQSN